MSHACSERPNLTNMLWLPCRNASSIRDSFLQHLISLAWSHMGRMGRASVCAAAGEVNASPALTYTEGADQNPRLRHQGGEGGARYELVREELETATRD
jgi:hypothetical protein